MSIPEIGYFFQVDNAGCPDFSPGHNPHRKMIAAGMINQRFIRNFFQGFFKFTHIGSAGNGDAIHVFEFKITKTQVIGNKILKVLIKRVGLFMNEKRIVLPGNGFIGTVGRL